jgi:tagatose 1,6-diphosphate aldolase
MDLLDVAPLVDGELELHHAERTLGDPRRNWVPAYRFEMRVTGVKAGTISLRVGSSELIERYAGHIGYGVEPPFRGRRYAARACTLLFGLARSHGLRTLWITCNPENLASRRTCERLGAKLVEIVPVPRDHPFRARGESSKCRYLLELA